jgi:hypothetical protein
MRLGEGTQVSPVGVDLYWIPLGAGGNFVRLNGKVYERIVALFQRRKPLDLYHAALQVYVPEGRFVIEQAPIPDGSGRSRGVVSEGPVGSRWAGRFRIFRYEVRCWLDGDIPDLYAAVDSPLHLTSDVGVARRVLEVVGQVPLLVWGRDELNAGEMWDSNSVVAWTIASSGLDAGSINPPRGGRAPGWRAGLVAAERSAAAAGRMTLTAFPTSAHRELELSKT